MSVCTLRTSRKKVLLICAVLIAVSLIVFLPGCNTQEYFDATVYDSDAELFKAEYEFYNGKKDEYGNSIRSLDIPIENPMIYALPKDILTLISEERSFVVYFGFPQCPWCRANIESLLLAAQDNEISQIYYINIAGIRDTYELKDDGPTEISVGTKGYYQLLDKLGVVLSDYVLMDGDKEYSVGEKRIYAPNVIVVKDGIPASIATDSKLISDPYATLDSEMKDELYGIYNDLFRAFIA